MSDVFQEVAHHLSFQQEAAADFSSTNTKIFWWSESFKSDEYGKMGKKIREGANTFQCTCLCNKNVSPFIKLFNKKTL